MDFLEGKASLDVYYDTPSCDLLRHPQAVFVRVREGRLLQCKFDEEAPTHGQHACIEREYVLSLQECLPEQAHHLLKRFLPSWQPAATWEASITANHLIEVARIDKHRRVYIDGPLIICVDDVVGLGSFVEIERNEAEGADIRAAEEHVRAVLRDLGGMPINAGYFEMVLQRNNHMAYHWVPSRFRVDEEHRSL
jgi:adenylate cyclase class IV